MTVVAASVEVVEVLAVVVLAPVVDVDVVVVDEASFFFVTAAFVVALSLVAVNVPLTVGAFAESRSESGSEASKSVLGFVFVGFGLEFVISGEVRFGRKIPFLVIIVLRCCVGVADF